MKPQTLPVKRRPAPKGIFKRLSAVTGNRKQRVAATAAPEMEIEDSSSKISRALTIIFLIHIVAIGLIFVHQRFLDGLTPDEPKVAKSEVESAVATTPARLDLPRMSTGEKPYVVRQGDNYARIAEHLKVDEGDLRLINKHIDIVPGLLLKIPPKRVVVETPVVAAAAVEAPAVPDSGLVDAVDVKNAPKATLVRPNITHGAKETPAPAAASGKSYVVQNGDNVWRIANRFKVNQAELMKANGITDPRKMKVGMNLVIPR
jgi:LysM repeat protein